MTEPIHSRTRMPRWGTRMLGALVLAGTGLTVGASPGSATHNFCHNEPFPGDVGVDVGPGFLFVGADTGTSGSLGTYAVCVNNDSVLVGVDTSGAVAVTASQCVGSSPSGCTDILGTTGVVQSGTTTVNLLPSTTIDTGYDLWVDGTNVGRLCVPGAC